MKKQEETNLSEINFPEDDELPDGWSIEKIGNITTFIGSGITPKGGREVYLKSGIPFLRSQNVYPDGLHLEDIACISEEMHAQMKRTHVFPRDVLLNITGASIGRSTYVPDNFPPANVNQHVCILRFTPKTFHQFASLFLNSSHGQKQIFDLQGGVTRQGLNYHQIRSIVIPLPPLPEQQRIVAKIEELFKEVDAAHDRLKRVPEILKHFRQAVLAAACSGRLTEGWREEHSEFKKREDCQNIPETIDETTVLQVNEIPGSWSWSKLGNVTLSMRNGIYKESKYYSETGFPCLRMYNIENGKIIWKNIKRMNLLDDEIEQYLLTPGDILINRVNSRELVGKSALITDKIEPCVYESKNIRLRVNSEKVNSNFVVFWLQLTAQQFFNLNAQQTVGMASINQDQISSMPIPLPPLEEQHEIIRRVESLFALADEIECQVVAATKRTDGLRRAILAKAFRGELVPTDAELGRAGS